jgi:6-phosphogluconolactonase (cycloisomerase 2 family)
MSTLARRHIHLARRLSVGLSALAAGALVTPAAASASAVKIASVYAETNGTPNQVIGFDRFSDGTLAETQRVATGGVGALNPARCALPPSFPACPLSDSQGSVRLTPGGRLLFAANLGSNTISSFRVTSGGGLQLADVVSSDGQLPQSIDTHGNVLYVLNQNSGTIAGFHFSPTGQLTEIAGSKRLLAPAGGATLSAQIGFDRTGRILAVTQRATDVIDTFVVSGDVAGPAIVHPSAGHQPFGFAFDLLGRLVVSDSISVSDGAASSYDTTLGGGLTPINTTSADGGAPCWVVITPDNRYAYITNTGTKTVSRFAIAFGGALTLLGVTPIVNALPGPVNIPTDDALSRDGRFLYVLLPGVFGGDVGSIDSYKVGPSGDLTFVSSTPHDLPAGVSGLAAR